MKMVRLFLLFLALVFVSCNQMSDEQAEDSPSKDESIRRYNIEMEKKQKRNNDNPCDTLSLKEYILNQDSVGTYLVEFDKTFTYSVPKAAVIYYADKRKKNQYIFAVIAKSKEGERLIEPKNVIGYESSFINLDSTKLGTAFFYLTLYECRKDSSFKQIWESEVPIHGGFNRMTLKNWKPKNIMYVELNYEDGIISGHRNYNFFLVDGIEKKPHLMETYVGLVHKRTLTKVDDDRYPDYWEFRFWEDSLSIRIRDSIPFYWDTTKSLYITKFNKRWFRHY
ncbi:MAG: hypothetical protein COW71_08585 [Ignavibacteriales bacterium CG18_big_fil_WC_8_21_14_2_50_31_20]|nr:MAG: hypothetical protein COW71_08585 [Ignavibacteriales bacterium CG18_big_fil_WC_8_21_14_2_50_31_20]